MRKLILKMSLTADGFVGGPNGELEWLFKSTNDEAAAWTVETISQAGVHIMGRKTFHDMKAYWPTSTEIFAEPMNKIPKVVFTQKGIIEQDNEAHATRALKDARAFVNAKTSAEAEIASWDNAIVADGDLATEIEALKKQEGKFILAHGGASFAQSLIKTGLVDEFRLLIHPVMIGKGLPIFSELEAPLYLRLASATMFSNGALAKIYRPKQ